MKYQKILFFAIPVFLFAGAASVFGLRESFAPTFSDVSRDSYFYNAVGFLQKKKIVSGYENGKFDPGGNVTRGQMSTILYRYHDEIVSKLIEELSDLRAFSVGQLTGKNWNEYNKSYIRFPFRKFYTDYSPPFNRQVVDQNEVFATSPTAFTEVAYEFAKTIDPVGGHETVVKLLAENGWRNKDMSYFIVETQSKIFDVEKKPAAIITSNFGPFWDNVPRLLLSIQ